MALYDRETWVPDANTQELQTQAYSRHFIWKKKSLVTKRRSSEEDPIMARVIGEKLLSNDYRQLSTST